MRNHGASRVSYLDPLKLAEARRDAGLKQAELAELAGTSRSQVSHHEKGDWGCKPGLLARYAKACGKKLKDLMRDNAA